MQLHERPDVARAGARSLTLGALSLALSACASIIHGSNQKVQVASTPSAATVTLDGVNKGATPVLLELKRGAEYAVRIEMAGYTPYEMKLKRGLDGWVWGNIVFGGPLGVIIDATTGAMYKVKPGSVDAALSRGDLTSSRTRDRLHIGVTLHVDSSWERIGTLTPALSR